MAKKKATVPMTREELRMVAASDGIGIGSKGKPVSVITSATSKAIPMTSDFAKKLQDEIAKNDAEIAAQKIASETDAPRCGNPKCNKDLRTVMGTYTVQDSKLQFCNRICRYEVLGGREPQPVATVVRTATTTPSEPKAPKATNSATRNSTPRAPKGSAVSGTIHIVEPSHKFSGIRGQVWAMITEGMAAQALIDLANAAGIDGKGVLRKFETHFKVVEVKN